MDRKGWWISSLAILFGPAAALGQEVPVKEVQPLRVFAPDIPPTDRNRLDDLVASFLDEYPELLARPYLPGATEDSLADLGPECVPPSGVEVPRDCLGRLAQGKQVWAVQWVSAQRRPRGGVFRVQVEIVDGKGESPFGFKTFDASLSEPKEIREQLMALWADRLRVPSNKARLVLVSGGSPRNVQIQRTDGGLDKTFRTPVVVDLEPGTYTISGVSEEVVLRSGSRRWIDVPLVAHVGTVIPPVGPEGLPGGTAAPESDEKEISVFKTWWFWTAVGAVVAVAGGVTTTLVLTKSHPATGSVRVGFSGNVFDDPQIKKVYTAP